MPSRQRAVMTISVPPPMAAEYRQLAKEKGESASELFREMFAFYKQHKLERKLKDIQEYGVRRLREVGSGGGGENEHQDMVLMSLDGYERMVAQVHLNEEPNVDNDVLWVREAEARYDEIASGKVVCRSLIEAVQDARTALK